MVLGLGGMVWGHERNASILAISLCCSLPTIHVGDRVGRRGGFWEKEKEETRLDHAPTRTPIPGLKPPVNNPVKGAC